VAELLPSFQKKRSYVSFAYLSNILVKEVFEVAPFLTKVALLLLIGSLFLSSSPHSGAELQPKGRAM
jgi:hypothetical protein